MATLAHQEKGSEEELVVLDVLDSAISREKGGGYIFSWPIKSIIKAEATRIDVLSTLFKHFKSSRV